MKKVYLGFVFFILTLMSCSEDNSSSSAGALVAFVNNETNITQKDTKISVVFSKAVAKAGQLVLKVEPMQLEYGKDFVTTPQCISNTLILPFEANATSVSFTFTKLVDAIEGEIKNVTFTIASVSDDQVAISSTSKSMQLHFNETPVLAKTFVAENGGNTFPNSLYVDLSSGIGTTVNRVGWELGFSSGTDFRVVLNPGVNGLAVKQLTSTNIDEVQVEDPMVTTGNYEPTSAKYVDHPSGHLNGTAIAEISAVDENNKVYLVNLGQSIASTPATGTAAALTGTARGWKKIRILRSGTNYKLQYATIDATTHNEIIIPKKAEFNHTFFSLLTNTIVNAEPLKNKWDLLFTPYVGYTLNGSENVSYFFADAVLTNHLNGTKAYVVPTSEKTYAEFTLDHVVASKFDLENAIERRAIGTNWRVTYPAASVKTDCFFVLKDAAGNIYKLKFNGLLSATGTRGTTFFEYVKLN